MLQQVDDIWSLSFDAGTLVREPSYSTTSDKARVRTLAASAGRILTVQVPAGQTLRSVSQRGHWTLGCLPLN